MAKELNPKLLEESQKTIDDALDKMSKFGKVFVSRPTGFGKTYMLTRIAKVYMQENPDKRILYVFPLTLIPSETKKKYGKNDKDALVRKAVNEYIDFKSYQELSLKFNKFGPEYWYDFLKDNYSVILLDEAHAAGSEGFRKIYETIRKLINKDGIHLIGVTATPNRMDDTSENSVLNDIFDNIEVYPYTLGDAIVDGIIKKLVIGHRNYNLEELAKRLRDDVSSKSKAKGLTFNKESFNVELGRAIQDTGTEGEFIYKYLPKAGYNLADPNKKYYKFICFFTNIQAVADRGPEVEKWIDDAFNNVARRELKLKREFTIRSHYITSSDTEDNEISSLVEKDENRYRHKNVQDLLNINDDKYVVDVIMTVNMTNMGYHDDNVTGILMLRGTKSEIIFYQQLGRVISVTSEYHPLIYDFVNNSGEKFWSKKDRKREIAKAILGDCIERREREGVIIDPMDIVSIVEGDEDVGEQFMNRWSDIYYSEKAKFIYLYEDRKAPIVAISADTGRSCTYIAKSLIESGIELRPEDEMYRFKHKVIESNQSSNDEKNNAVAIMKGLNSRLASDYYSKIKKTTQTLFNFVIKLMKG